MQRLMISLLLLSVLNGCGSQQPAVHEDQRNAESLIEAEEEIDQSVQQVSASNPIRVTGSFTLSRNNLFEFIQKHEYLSVVQISGKYFEDWSPGPFMGRTWEGEFQIQLSDENGEVKSSVDLNDYFDEVIVFNSLFDIEFDDYNGDGNIDLSIGQYASSNGGIYKLFTIDSTIGQIKELPIRGHKVIFVSGTGRYSTKLTKTETGFASSYYDNRIGETVKQNFLWNGEEFVSDK